MLTARSSNAPSDGAPAKRKRTPWNKSRRGCSTCKKRRIKCDEAYPSCKNCLSTGRVCGGTAKDTFIVVSKQYSQNLSIPPVPGPTKPSLERRQFAYFVHCGAYILGGSLDSELYADLLPAIATEDSMIWNALLVLATLSEHPMPLNKLPVELANAPLAVQDEHHRNALRWYGKALTKARELGLAGGGMSSRAAQGYKDGKLLSLALLSCILFAAIEKQLGNARNGLVLAQRAFELVGLRMTGSVRDAVPVIDSAVLPVLLKLSVPIAIFGQRVPEPLRRAAMAYREYLVKGTLISRLKELRFRLLEIAYDTQILLQEIASQRYEGCEERQRNLLALLDDWWDEYQEVSEQQQSKVQEKMQTLAFCLQMLYRSFRIQIECCFDGSHMLMDNFREDFEQILRDAEDLTQLTRQIREHARGYLPFEVGTLYCVHFVAWECRYPALRRRALNLLRQASARESFWTSSITLRIIEKTVALEEGIDDVDELPAGSEEKLPPERQRLHLQSCADLTIIQVRSAQPNLRMAPQEARPMWRPNADGTTSLVLQTCREELKDDERVLEIEEHLISDWNP